MNGEGSGDPNRWAALLKGGGLDGVVLSGFEADRDWSLMMSSIWLRTTIIPMSSSRRGFGS
jgi:hypothetical protein